MPPDVLDHILKATNARPCGRDRWMGHGICHGSKRNRDLSIRKTDDRILLHDFTGCELSSICRALGIQKRDLFFDARIDPVATRQRKADRLEREQQQERDGFQIDAYREAEYTIAAASGIDISNWSNERLGDALNVLADAYATLEAEYPR